MFMVELCIAVGFVHVSTSWLAMTMIRPSIPSWPSAKLIEITRTLQTCMRQSNVKILPISSTVMPECNSLISVSDVFTADECTTCFAYVYCASFHFDSVVVFSCCFRNTAAVVGIHSMHIQHTDWSFRRLCFTCLHIAALYQCSTKWMIVLGCRCWLSFFCWFWSFFKISKNEKKWSRSPWEQIPMLPHMDYNWCWGPCVFVFLIRLLAVPGQYCKMAGWKYVESQSRSKKSRHKPTSINT